MKVGIIDYGLGNIFSIYSALSYLEEYKVIVSSKLDELDLCDKLILPGVGNFGEGMQRLRQAGLDDFLFELKNSEKHILGICLGMQLFTDKSAESDISGLGIIKGKFEKFPIGDLKVPHVGFNDVTPREPYSGILMKNLPGFTFYFTHSYFFKPSEDLEISMTSYGVNFVSSYEKDNFFGVQFHPELSKENGLHLLQNFLKA